MAKGRYVAYIFPSRPGGGGFLSTSVADAVSARGLGAVAGLVGGLEQLVVGPRVLCAKAATPADRV